MRTKEEMDLDYDKIIIRFNWKRMICWRIFATDLCKRHQYGDGLIA